MPVPNFVCFHSPQFGRRFQRQPSSASRGQLQLGSGQQKPQQQQQQEHKDCTPATVMAIKSPPLVMRRLSRKCQHWLTGGSTRCGNGDWLSSFFLSSFFDFTATSRPEGLGD
jgi:hypothetical protein